MNSYDEPRPDDSEDDEDREITFGGLETDQVTAKEYQRAIDTLEEVVELDPQTIQNIEDLTAHISLVGEEVKKIVLASGHIQVTKFEYQKPDEDENTKAIDRAWVIRKPVGDHQIVALSVGASATIEAYQIQIEEGKEHQLSIYNVIIPLSSEMSNPRLSMGLFAVDWREGEVKSYYPARETDNAQVQQGFLRVLQDAIKELLSVIDQPLTD